MSLQHASYLGSVVQPVLDAVIPPVLAGLLVAFLIPILRALHPILKWRHAAKRDSTILAGLPPGEERRAWESVVELQAFRIRRYQDLQKKWMAWLGKILSWLATAGVIIVVVGSLLIFYFEPAGGWKAFAQRLSIPLVPLTVLLAASSLLHSWSAKKKADEEFEKVEKQSEEALAQLRKLIPPPDPKP